MAMPPLKYFGRHNDPSGPWSIPLTCRKIRYRPRGVRHPDLPVLVLKTHRVRPPRTTKITCRSMSTSMIEPLLVRALASPSRSMTAQVLAPQTPSRLRPCIFCTAMTACSVVTPKLPSLPECQYPCSRIAVCSRFTAAPLLPFFSSGWEPPPPPPSSPPPPPEASRSTTRQVFGPQIPSRARPWSPCRRLTARSVEGPNCPSTPECSYPALSSLRCSSRTADPLLPLRSVGWLAATAGTTPRPASPTAAVEARAPRTRRRRSGDSATCVRA